MRSIIGFSGKARHGKDTVGSFFAESAPKIGVGEWEIDNFAKPVKEIVSKIFGVSLAFIEEWKAIDSPPPGWNKTMREALVFVGNGARNFNPDVWVNHLVRRRSLDNDEHRRSAPNLYITDVRYANEAKWIRSMNGGIVVRIHNPSAPLVATSRNPSEVELDKETDDLIRAGIIGQVPASFGSPFDYILYNDETLNDLKKKVQSELIPFIESWVKFMIV